MNNENEEEKRKFYSNSVSVSSSNYDLQMSFFQKSLLDEKKLKDEQKEYYDKFLVEITMSLNHTKAFLLILQDAIKKHEESYGEILLEPKKSK